MIHETEQTDNQSQYNKQKNNFNEFSVLVSTIVEMFKEPVADIEKNVKAVISESMSKMDLVTKDELDRQTALLATSQEKLALLEKKFNELERKNKS